jgi:pimeloyl-ACP methyl ester carboxylesterase
VRLEELPPVAGVEHRWVDIGGVRLHVAEAGSGPPLVLLHGWPQHWWSWRKLIGPLAETHRVLAVDLRGYGWSDAPPGDSAKQTWADDVIALLDAEGIERTALVGHDWGGFVGFLLALDRPERIERYVALDIAPPFRPHPHPGLALFPLFLSYQFVVATPGLGLWLHRSGRLVPTILRLGTANGFSFTPEEVAAYTEAFEPPERARAAVRTYRTFLTRELPGRLRHPRDPSELTVPTRLVMGAEGALNRIFAPEPAGELEVHTIPGAGHFLAEEAPDATLAHIREHLAA